MNNKINFKNIIWKIENELRGVLLYKNIEFAVVRLLFLKYAVDNYIGATSVENMQLCAKAQKMFALKDIENGVDTIIPVLRYIDEAYNLDNILSGSENIEEYARVLFGEDISRQKKNVVTSDFKGVLDTLGSLDLEEKEKTNSVGKELVEALLETISINSTRSSYSNEYTTRQNLSKLAGKILDVKSDDVFCDFASGVGLSTIEITKETMPKIINADLNNTAVAISAMLYIMLGYKDFKIFNENTLTTTNIEVHGDKVFVDGPLASKIEKTEYNEYNDSTLAIINKVLNDALSNTEDALAVITVPSSPLFTTKRQTVELREKMLTSGMLKAVIALPPMWRGTNVGTNLLVFSREKNSNAVFVNAADVKVSQKDRNEVTGEALLPSDKIDCIADAVNNSKTIAGFSRVISYADINNDFNLVPANYIQAEKEEETITLEELDNQIAELYKKLLG